MRHKITPRPLTRADIGMIARRIKRAPATLDGMEIVHKGHIIFVYFDTVDGRPNIAEVWDSEGRERAALREALQLLCE